MNKRSYGWVSYYFNLLRLIFLGHSKRVAFIRDRARKAQTSQDAAHRLRTFLHCTDWPLDLRHSFAFGESPSKQAEGEELLALQSEMLELYQTEQARQGGQPYDISPEVSK